MRKRKFLALFCCSILFLSLTACNVANSNSTSAVDTGKPAAPTIAETESNAEPVAPSSTAEDSLPSLGEQDVTPAQFDEVTLQWKNDDGYTFEGTFAISDWIKYDDENLLNATWKSVADGKAFPNVTGYMPFGEEMTFTQCKRTGHLTGDIVYAVGYYQVKNVTPDFSITTSNQTDVILRFYANTLFTVLAAYVDDNQLLTYDVPATGVVKVEDEIMTDPGIGGCFGGTIGTRFAMNSNDTGRRPFMIAVSLSTTTPNRPNPLPDISQVTTEVRFYNHDPSINNGETISHVFEQNLTW